MIFDGEVRGKTSASNWIHIEILVFILFLFKEILLFEL